MLRWPWRRWIAGYRGIGRLRDLVGGRVEVAGIVRAGRPIHDPVSGEDCVVIVYRAWPPSTTVGIDGATSHGSRAFQVEARQAAEFVLDDGTASVRVRFSRGVDVADVHDQLVERYGVGLRTERELVRDGARVRVLGRATLNAGTDPHRRDPEVGVVEADELWPFDGPRPV